MSQYDIFRLKTNRSLVLNCQSDLLDALETRFVAPLMNKDKAPKPAKRLNPEFIIEGQHFVLLPQFAATIKVSEIETMITSLAEHHIEISNAFDMLLNGF